MTRDQERESNTECLKNCVAAMTEESVYRNHSEQEHGLVEFYFALGQKCHSCAARKHKDHQILPTNGFSTGYEEQWHWRHNVDIPYRVDTAYDRIKETPVASPNS